MSDLKTPVADEARGEILLPIAGTPRVVRFSMKFLKHYTKKQGTDSPSEVLDSLKDSPVDALMDMVALGVRLSVPEVQDFSGDDALDVIDELGPEEQEKVFAVLVKSLKANPIVAALNTLKAAE